jgi:SAM-dependent methyltransferase
MSTSPSLQQIKESMRNAWMAGDFGVVAKRISSEAEAFVSRLTVSPGTEALDVGCGTGNVALPLARAGAVVTGVDIAPNLLAQAHERAAQERLAIAFDEGDAEQLPYEECSFDLAVTMFGAMFAPRPEVVASELARVLKPGGRLAMANWTPQGFSGRMFHVGSRHHPPPPGISPPVMWGEDEVVRKRLGGNFREIRTELIPIEFEFPTNPAGVVAFFREYFGPTRMAFERLDEAGRSALAADLESLWSSANVAADPEQQTLVHNEYLQVTAVRI